MTIYTNFWKLSFTVMLLAAGLHSCIYEEPDLGDNPAAKGTLTLKIAIKDPIGAKTPAHTRAGTPEPGTVAENEVTNLGVWGFKPGASGGDDICTFFRYLSKDELPSGAANGTFTQTFVGWDGKSTNLLILANLRPDAIPVVEEEIGKQRSVVFEANTTRVLTPDTPLTPPLPMSFMTDLAPYTPDTPVTVQVDLIRSVARLRVKLIIDDSQTPGLKDMMHPEDATASMENLVDRCLMIWAPNAPETFSAPGVQLLTTTPVQFQGPNADGAYTLPDSYLYYKSNSVVDGKEEPVTLTLHLPYTKDGTDYGSNFYKAYLRNQKGDSYDNNIVANRSYDLTLRVFGLGDDMGMKTELQCQPWNTVDETLPGGGCLDNTEFVIYADQVRSGLATRIRHSWSSLASPYTVSCSPGVTFVGEDNSKPGMTGLLVSVDGEVTDGWIDVRQGGKSERVTLYKKGASQIATGETVQLDANYTQLENMTNWATMDNTSQSGQSRLTVAGNYIAGVAGTNRKATLKVLDQGSQQTVYMYIEQDGVALPAYDNQIKDGYAGTYHRYNERAERVIQMPNSDGGVWSASVVSGADFIALSTTPSADTGLGTTDPKKGWALEDGNYNVTDGVSRVCGTGKDIYFRVGLNSSLNSDTEVRYGVVVVKHDGGKDHYIFVRQGEGVIAGKFSPYNLKSPDDNYDGNGVNRPGSGCKFTDYPTQTGSYYRWNVQTNVRPDWPVIKNYTLDSNLGKDPFNTTREPCPTGYKTPELDCFKYLSGAEWPAGTFKQKLWQNVLGKYADGWYDRVEDPSSDDRGLDIAWKGMVMFDPSTYESLFFPYAGVRAFEAPNQGKRVEIGNRGMFWSRERDPSFYPDTHSYVAYPLSLHSPEYPDRAESLGGTASRYIWIGASARTSFGISVRCVKK